MDHENLKELLDAYTLLRETNAKLYSSMKAFQIAAEESGSLVFTYDTRAQTIFVDEKTAKAFGVATIQEGIPYDMVRRGIITEDTAADYIRIHEEMINGALESGGIVKLIQADGSCAVHDLKFRAILDEEGNPTGTAIGIYRNINERYLKDLNQERYGRILYSSSFSGYEYDPETDILAIFTPSAQIGGGEVKFLFDHFTSRLEAGEFCAGEDTIIIRDAIKNGFPTSIQVRLKNPDTGERRWYQVTGSFAQNKNGKARLFGSFADIQHMKVQEAEYHRLERILQSIKDQYIGIFEIDLEQDTCSVVCYNDKTSPLMPENGSYSEMGRCFFSALAAPDYQEQLLSFCSLQNLLHALSIEPKVETEYMTNQNRSWQRITFHGVEYQGQTPLKVIMYQQDIDRFKTEQLSQQQAIREAYQYAEAANAAKSSFLSHMSHDIRTPMNAIIGMTAIAGTHIGNPEKVSECLGKITQASKHLLGLINEVLDMSKIESGKIELQEDAFCLSDLIDNMVSMVLPQIQEHNHKLSINIEHLKHENVIGDSLRIQQAFVNLISNAVKYTPNGGNIHVTITERPLNIPGYGEYEFCFEDNGIGMSREFLLVLFEPFKRAEDGRLSSIPGTGLGMTITKNLILMMDGDIQVESELNKGSRFTVKIHLKLQDETDETLSELLDLPVLVVDDDICTCESTCIMLQDIGMKGEWCQNGPDAIRLIADRHERGLDYFAVILDWKMPDMNGIDTAKRIRQLVGDEIPIIFLTAYDWSAIEADARAAGVNHFLSKPLFKSRLINSFRELTLPQKEKETDLSSLSISEDFSGKRILLAEDNELNAEIAKELIGMTGAVIEHAANGGIACTMFEKSPVDYYDMILMDIQMPVLNGYSAATAIRSMDRPDAKRIPIIAMTANAFAEDVTHAVSCGMNEHLAKPIDLKLLKNVLAKYFH